MSNKRVLITGGSKGIGREIVLRTAEAGFDVTFTYNNSESEAHALADQVSAQFGVDIDVNRVDFSCERDTQRFGELIADTAFYGFVHNAGASYDSLSANYDDERAKRLMRLNFWSFSTLFKFLVREMVRSKGGRVVAISSIASLRGNKGNGIYAASKAALTAYVRVVAAEYAKKGIVANAIAPGFVATSLLSSYSNSFDQLASSIPIKRFGEPTEIAELVNFLLSERCSYITGETIAIDGGLVHCGL